LIWDSGGAYAHASVETRAPLKKKKQIAGGAAQAAVAFLWAARE
jgi:hypothetical protein